MCNLSHIYLTLLSKLVFSHQNWNSKSYSDLQERREALIYKLQTNIFPTKIVEQLFAHKLYQCIAKHNVMCKYQHACAWFQTRVRACMYACMLAIRSIVGVWSLQKSDLQSKKVGHPWYQMFGTHMVEKLFRWQPQLLWKHYKNSYVLYCIILICTVQQFPIKQVEANSLNLSRSRGTTREIFLLLAISFELVNCTGPRHVLIFFPFSFFSCLSYCVYMFDI